MGFPFLHKEKDYPLLKDQYAPKKGKPTTEELPLTGEASWKSLASTWLQMSKLHLRPMETILAGWPYEEADWLAFPTPLNGVDLTTFLWMSSGPCPYSYILVPNSSSFPEEMQFGLYLSLWSQLQTSRIGYSVQLSLRRVSDWHFPLGAHLHGRLAATSVNLNMLKMGSATSLCSI